MNHASTLVSPRFAVACVLVSSFLFSLKAIVVKQALISVPHMNGEMLLALRMGFALPFFAFMAMRGQPLRQIQTNMWIRIGVAGVFGYYLASVLDFIGLEYIDASLERLILFLYPTLTVVFGAVFLGKRISRVAFVGLVVSYVGTLWIMAAAPGNLFEQRDLLLGSALVFVSAVAYAAYLMLAEPVAKSLGKWQSTGLMAGAATLASLLHVAVTPGLSELQSVVTLQSLSYGLVLGIFATVIPMLLVIVGIERIGASLSALISAGGPVLTLLLAAIFLGERLTGMQLLGAAANIGGVLLIAMAASGVFLGRPRKPGDSPLT